MAQKVKLNSRQKLILIYMNGRHSVVPGKELAERLGVSTRTVRGAVSEINDLLAESGIRITALSGKGYRLEVENRGLFHEIITDRDAIHTKEDRIIRLIIRLLESDDWVDLSLLEDDMFISRTTLENDIREIRLRLSEYEPRIQIKRKNNFLLLEDDEMKKRDVLVHIYSISWDFDSREGLSFGDHLLDRDVMEKIRQELVSALGECRIKLDDYGMVIMKLACSLIYARTIEGHRLYNAGPGHRFGVCRRAVDLLLGRLRPIWDLEIEDADYVWLTNYLERLQILGLSLEDDEYAAELAGEECRAAADRLEEELASLFGITFPGDRIFRSELLLSTKSFFDGQLSTQGQSVFSTDQLEKNYEIYGDAARYLTERLEEMSGRRIRQEEQNWLLPMLCSAVERRERAERDRIRVVVISHLNAGLTRYLRDNLYKLFGTRMTIVAVEPVHNRRAVLSLEPTLVVTTVKMRLFEDLGIPCVVTSAVITEEELIRIDGALQAVERRAVQNKPAVPAGEFLARGGTVQVPGKRSLREAMTAAFREWGAAGLVPPGAEPGTERMRYVPLGEEGLFAYRVEGAAGETFFSEVLLEAPIRFRHQKTLRKIVAGLISPEDREAIPAIYEEMRRMGLGK